MAEMKVTITGGRNNLGEQLTVQFDGPVLVGRSHAAAIRFSNEEPDVSGRHLEFSCEDGRVWVRNLKRTVKVNGVDLVPDERREVRVGDSFEIGVRARFRVDALPGVEDPQAGDASTVTGETRMMTEATFATQAVPDLTEVTRPAEVTVMTRAADVETAIASDETVAVDMSAESGDDSPTEAFAADNQTVTGSDPNTDGSTMILGGQDGETNKIPQWLLDDLNKKQRQKETHRRRVRHTVIAVAFLAFAGVLGAIVYTRWPKAERWATVPLIAGTDDLDIELHDVLDACGKKLMTVDYPRNVRMKKSVQERGRGIDVSTYTGRDRSIPFRLRLSLSAGAVELSRSLKECAETKIAAAERSGFVFQSPAEFPAGMFFFEDEYPGSCPSPRLLRGTAFYRSEYEMIRSGVKWHGVLIVFRDGDNAYTLQREVVDSEWERCKLLLRKDPNIGFSAEFLNNRWESPGRDGFVREQDAAECRADVVRELSMSTPRTASWVRLKRELDTLVATSWTQADARQDALSLLARFRKVQDAKYVELRNEFDLAGKAGHEGLERRVSVRADCQRIFGLDPSDRRFLLINNPENWSCLDEP